MYIRHTSNLNLSDGSGLVVPVRVRGPQHERRGGPLEAVAAGRAGRRARARPARAAGAAGQVLATPVPLANCAYAALHSPADLNIS